MASILGFPSGNDNVNVTPAFLDYPMVDYEVSLATKGMHNTPRFGHTNNFSSLFAEDDQETSEDYTQGLMFVGSFLLALFGFWCLVLLLFKVLGCKYRSLGFLSGRQFTLDDDKEPTQDEYAQWKARSTRIRIVFLVSALLLLLFSNLMISQGFKQLEETRVIADTSLENARYLVRDATVLTNELRDVGLAAMELRDKLIVELADERLCPNDPSYLAQTEITKTIQDNAGLAIDMLAVLGEFATKDLKKTEDGLQVANNVISNLDNAVEFVEEREWVGVGFVVPLVILTILMMIGVLLSFYERQNECYEFTLSWILLPMFLFWIVASCIFCGLMAISATVNADFCGGTESTPDNTIFQALRSKGLNQSSTEFQIARYYLNQCTREAEVDPFLFLRVHQAEINNAQAVMDKLSESLEKMDVVDLSFNCGRDFEPLSSSLDTMSAILDRLDQAGKDGLKLLSCERLVPIYTDVVYDGTCTSSVTGLTWILSSLLIISVTGLVMITLRSSYLSDVILSAVDDSAIAMKEAIDRGKHVARAASYSEKIVEDSDLWLHEQTARQDTSDSESIYTEDEKRLHVNVEVEKNTGYFKESPKLYELEENSYDSRGNLQASAPYEHEMYDYGGYDGYNTNTNYKSRVY